MFTGDFDADKRSDLVCRRDDGMEYQIALSGLYQSLNSFESKIMTPGLYSQSIEPLGHGVGKEGQIHNLGNEFYDNGVVQWSARNVQKVFRDASLQTFVFHVTISCLPSHVKMEWKCEWKQILSCLSVTMPVLESITTGNMGIKQWLSIKRSSYSYILNFRWRWTSGERRFCDSRKLVQSEW